MKPQPPQPASPASTEYVEFKPGLLAFAYEQCHLLDEANASARKAPRPTAETMKSL